MRAYPEINWRYIIQLEKPVVGLGELNFNGIDTWFLQHQGQLDAAAALGEGPGGWKKHLNFLGELSYHL
jgi:hypothetical protein